MLALYDALFALTASPVVAINRALAIAEILAPTAPTALSSLDDALDANAERRVSSNSELRSSTTSSSFDASAPQEVSARYAEAARRALAQLPDPAHDPRLETYQPYWAARAELLSRSGASAESRRAYDLAIGLESDPAVRNFLLLRQSALPTK